MLVRRARPSDARNLAKIWYEGWLDGHSGHVPAELEAARTEGSFQQRAVERLSEAYVAEVDGTMVGFFMLADTELEQFYVDRGSRGQGVATELMEAVEAEATRRGRRELWLAVAAGNVRGRRFYERAGWIDDGPFDYDARVGVATIRVPCHRFVRQLAGHAVGDPRGDTDA
jgi:GNAT superfamily N-acetyltransferase